MILPTILALFVAATAAPQDAPPPTPVRTVPDTPEMAEARANKPLAKTRPKLLSGLDTDAIFPDAARAEGAHGKVVVSGIIGRDGRFLQPLVTTSSRSELLDAAAIAAAREARFEPAKDAAGNPISVPAAAPAEFSNTRPSSKGGGVLHYKCDQFVRDQDWWAANWPATESDEIYHVTLGLLMIQGGLNADNLRRSTSDLKQHWARAVESCRKQPDALFIDMLKPEGKALRALAESGNL